MCSQYQESSIFYIIFQDTNYIWKQIAYMIYTNYGQIYEMAHERILCHFIWMSVL